MTETLLNEAVKSGLWALLFVALFIYVMKETRDREKEYQAIIKQLNCDVSVKAGDNFKAIEEVGDVVDKLHDKIQVIDEKVNAIDHKVDKVNEKIEIIDQRMCD